MISVPEAQLTQFERFGTTLFCIEASTLGLKPGEWPEEIEVVTSGGVKRQFTQTRVKWHKALIAAMVYTHTGDELHVLND